MIFELQIATLLCKIDTTEYSTYTGKSFRFVGDNVRGLGFFCLFAGMYFRFLMYVEKISLSKFLFV